MSKTYKQLLAERETDWWKPFEREEKKKSFRHTSILNGTNRLKDSYTEYTFTNAKECVVYIDEVVDAAEREKIPFKKVCRDHGWIYVSEETKENPYVIMERKKKVKLALKRKWYKENPPQIIKAKVDGHFAEVEYKSGVKRLYLTVPKTVHQFAEKVKTEFENSKVREYELAV